MLVTEISWAPAAEIDVCWFWHIGPARHGRSCVFELNDDNYYRRGPSTVATPRRYPTIEFAHPRCVLLFYVMRVYRFDRANRIGTPLEIDETPAGPR